MATKKQSTKPLKITSWNVNGLRAAHKKGFLDYVNKEKPYFLGVQEVRAHDDDIPDELKKVRGYQTSFVAASKKGYSGVGAYMKDKPSAVETSLNDDAFDAEGRYQSLRFGNLRIVNCYFPNGNGRLRDNSRVPFKLDFTRRVFDVVELEMLAGRPVFVMGDFNVAHDDIDLARPKENRETSGFTPIEREELGRWLSRGFVDTFRHFHDDGGHYSWWSQRFGVRAKNIGWRIDYILASPGAMPFVKDAFIRKDVTGSDHCPVGITVDPAILDA